MLLELPLVREQPIEGAVQPIVVDQRGGQREQVFQRGAAVPVLGDVQFARRLAQAGQHQHRRHGRPRHGLPPVGQQPLQHLVQPQRPPERPPQPDLAEGAASLQANPLELDRDVLDGRGLEEIRLLPPAGDRLRQRLRAGPALGVEFSQVGDGLLTDCASHTDRGTGGTEKSTNLVGTTRAFPRQPLPGRTHTDRAPSRRAVSLLKLRKLG